MKAHSQIVRVYGIQNKKIVAEFSSIPSNPIRLLALKECDQIIIEDSDHKLIELKGFK